MQEATCNRCGASVVLSAKFCRQCGNLLDASEMTTRSLDAEPPPFDHGTRPANAGITAPTYPAALAPPQPPAPIYGSAPPSNNKTVLFVVLGVVVAMLIGLGVAAFLVFGRLSGSPDPPPPVEGATSGKESQSSGRPPPPGVPPPVPAPPQAGDVKNPFDASLVYPGAKTVMSVNSKDGKVAQLQSADPLDKVADWYEKKIKPTEDTHLPGSRIMKGGGITVILAGGPGGTSITLTDDKD